MMPGVFNETSLLLLFVGSFISCCLQLVHVPLTAAGRNRRLALIGLFYELGVANHLFLAADYMIGILSNTGTFAADTILASQWGHFLWGNVITVAYGIAFCIYLKHPVMIPDSMQ